MAETVRKIWHLLPHDPPAINKLAKALNIAPIVAQLLLNRGISEPEVAQRFLDAPLSGLHPPQLLPGVNEATERIHQAIQAGKKICIYGDYDVDGVTGTSILIHALRLLDAKVDMYLPRRLEEGYGLNCEALKQIAKMDSSMVITVDCGITSVEEAEEAKRLGLELIVTDHHEFKDTLPDATVLVHPRLPGSEYPFGYLSGSAVAFKLAWALCQKSCGSEKVTPRFREFLLDGVALASLGIVADVVPLHDENRIFVKHGLSRLRAAPPLGLKLLCESAGMTPGAKVRAGDIGFKLGPRLNAAGRLGWARIAVDLLTETKPQMASDLVRHLEQRNIERQKLEREVLRQARQMVEENVDDLPALVLASPDWHPGIIGIVASRLVDMFGRPALMISLQSQNGEPESPTGQGSGRSIPGLALNEVLQECTEYLISHGGHKAAAGFRIEAEQIDEFRTEFCRYVERRFPSGPPAPSLIIDAEIPLAALTVGLVKELDKLEPYGSANRKPVFMAGDLQVSGEPRKVGQGERHLQFAVRQGRTVNKAIAFGMSERLDELMSKDGKCCLAFTPRINEWMGRRTVDLEIVDLQAGSQAKLSELPLPDHSTK